MAISHDCEVEPPCSEAIYTSMNKRQSRVYGYCILALCASWLVKVSVQGCSDILIYESLCVLRGAGLQEGGVGSTLYLSTGSKKEGFVPLEGNVLGSQPAFWRVKDGGQACFLPSSAHLIYTHTPIHPLPTSLRRGPKEASKIPLGGLRRQLGSILLNVNC